MLAVCLVKESSFCCCASIALKNKTEMSRGAVTLHANFLVNTPVGLATTGFVPTRIKMAFPLQQGC